ncbi:coadhesin-like [Haliotis rufescens]|uniref:coadhesin-like n=1 Tax=Haliotis rufescens TaxID=6454 RepID=UPI00201F508B|nr:coadhesin-like [Haliotis rufescens]
MTTNHPNIFRFITLIKSEQSMTEVTISQLQSGGKKRPKKKQYRQLEHEIDRLKVCLPNNGKTKMEYRDAVSHLGNLKKPVMPQVKNAIVYSELRSTPTFRFASYQTDIDGGVSEWQEWGDVTCAQTCGVNVTGTRTRLRSCDNPLRQNNGKTCVEQGLVQQESSRILCDNIPESCGIPVDGAYEEWSSWLGECPTTCGLNVRYVRRRNRTCDSPKPQNGGLDCQGSHSEEKTSPCDIPPCPGDIVDGGYGEWSQWAGATCTKTCGVGVTVNIYRNRSCDSPAPQNGGLPCSGTNYESTSMECNISPCPDDVVDGGYSPWGQWSADNCSATCGVQITKLLNRYRRCDSPVPLNGGKPCEGSYYQQKYEVCEGIPPCPGQVVNGSFSQWSEWTQTSCPKTCGVDVETLQRRSRACDNPPPFNGGLPCDGSTSQERNWKCTNLSPCPVDGGVSEWGGWDTPRCPTCGENVTGVSLRLRPCDNPVPANNGSFCIEPVQEIVVRSCEVARCPVDGGFSEWGEWSNPDCPVTCGREAKKVVSRNRNCTEPPPQFGGANCTGPSEESANRSCNHTECPSMYLL